MSKQVGDFFKFFGLLRKSQLYVQILLIWPSIDRTCALILYRDFFKFCGLLRKPQPFVQIILNLAFN